MSEPGSAPAHGATATRFRVGEMDCPSCVGKIEGRLCTLDGVESVQGNVVSRTLTVRHSPSVSVERMRDEMGRLGYAAHPLDQGAPPPGGASVFGTPMARRTFAAAGLFLLGTLVWWAGFERELVDVGLWMLTPADALFLLAAAVGGSNFFDRGWRALRVGALDMNFLMTVAIAGAAVIGETMEAAAIAFLFGVASLLEGYAVDRARASVGSLMSLAPDTARLVEGDAERMVPADELVPGQRIRVRPGERLPVDGRVVAGRSAIDESPITGESMPADRGPGDPVWAGTVNREGALDIEVEREPGRSTLARIVQMVDEAAARKSRTERFVERFARVYTPAVTALAVLVVALPPVLLGDPFLPWFVRGLTLLVIACPCALVISTPVAVVSGITAGARNGVLIKGGSHLEAMGSVRVVALDKTGTLTVGHPRVDAVQALGGASADEVLARAAAVERRSEHPVARAVVDEAERRGLTLPRTLDFRADPGSGVHATVDGVPVRVGRPGALAGSVEPPPELRRGGGTVVGVEQDGRLIGWISLRDQPRPDAARVVAGLREAGIERVVMLTGDRPAAAEHVAEAAGIEEVRAGLLPEQKVEAVQELEERWGPVAMVGDGVNDAPALGRATVGIAMGAAGSDTALETADVALMADDLSRLPYLVRLSSRAGTVIRQNVALALLVKGALAAAVPLGHVSLVAAVVVGDLGLSLLVIANALRLARVHPPAPEEPGPASEGYHPRPHAPRPQPRTSP